MSSAPISPIAPNSLEEPLRLILGAAPNWTQCQLDPPSAIAIEAAFERDGGQRSRTYLLRATMVGDLPRVREELPGTLLPKRCPERHIEERGLFCLGLHRHVRVDNASDAQTWWGFLRAFLSDQEIVHNLGRWPSAHALSHGRAGEIEESARKIAEQAGIGAEFDAAVARNEGWLAGPLPRVARDGTRFVNGLAPCVRDCRQGGHVRLRKWCLKRCTLGKILPKLVKLETERRVELADFYAEIRASDFICCGTVEGCPLQAQ